MRLENQYRDDTSLMPGEVEIYMTDALRSILKRVILIGLAVAAAYYGGQYYAEMFLTPKYQASSMLYLFTDSFGQNQYGDLRISNLMAEDYEIIAGTDTVIGEILEENGISGTVAEIKEGLSLMALRESHLLQISLKGTDPEKCQQVVNLLALRIRDMIAEESGGSPPSIVTMAPLPRGPYYPRVGRIAKAWAISTAVVLCGIFIFYDYLNRPLRNELDVQRLLNLKVLGAIPAPKTIWQKIPLWLLGFGPRKRGKKKPRG